MIAYLQGIVLEKQINQVVLNVNGVGYEVFVPFSTFCRLAEVGKLVELLIHFVVREDAQLLYGFLTAQERALFRALIKVNGVGPKLALGILSGMDVPTFVECIFSKNMAALVSLPGVGKKTAERLLIEMRDHLQELNDSDTSLTKNTFKVPESMGTRQRVLDEAISGLVALGYKSQEAISMIKRVDDGERLSSDLIRAALKETVSV